MKITKIIKKNPDLFYTIYKFYLPIKRLKNKKRYDKQYEISMKELKKVKNRKIFFIGVPIHSNIGDLAQYYCIKKWLQKYYNNYDIIEFTDNIIYTNHKNIINKIKNIINADDIFVFQSGYRTTDVANFEGEYAHQKILSNFKNKVIVFPQTINFKSEKEKNKSKLAYRKNNNYLFLARDEISYKTAIEMYDENKVALYPDIVTSLIGNCELVDKKKEKNGILFCLRNDDEKLYTNEQYEQVINKLNKITDKIDITDTNSSKDFEFDRSETENELRAKLNQFSNYKLIITDRYHGTIFSLISNTNVIVLNSTDHKLSSGVNWFEGVYDDYVCYCSKLEDIYAIASKKYKNDLPKIIKPYFKDHYYDKLYDRIKGNNRKSE